jgi:hypothetical protein
MDRWADKNGHTYFYSHDARMNSEGYPCVLFFLCDFVAPYFLPLLCWQEKIRAAKFGTRKANVSKNFVLRIFDFLLSGGDSKIFLGT